MSKQAALRATGGLLVLAFFGLVLLVATSPRHVVYDEHYFSDYVPLLHRYGFTPAFLNALTGMVGPLYAFVHVAFEPLTGLQPVGMRLVNVFLLLIAGGLVAAWLRRRHAPGYWVAGLSVLVVPMSWVLAGMALTEMPALAFATLSLYLLLRGLDTLGRDGRSLILWFAASAVALGLAVWGRQPYLLLVGVPVLLALLERRLRPAAVLYVIVVVGIFAAPLFAIWQGLMPPVFQGESGGLAPLNAVISLGYTGLCLLLLAPATRWFSWPVLLGIAALTAIANALLGLVALHPLRSLADRWLPAAAAAAYGNLVGSLFLACGVAFLAATLRTMWRQRADLEQVAINSGLLAVAVSPMFIGHQYSSRYTAMALPYLVLAAQPWRTWDAATLATAALGCGLGAASLYGYLSAA